MTDWLKKAGDALKNPQNLLDGAALATTTVPGVGDALGLAADAYNMAANPEERTWGNVGIAALGAVPFLPNSGSVKRVGDKLDLAKRLEDLTGFDPKSIRLRQAGAEIRNNSRRVGRLAGDAEPDMLDEAGEALMKRWEMMDAVGKPGNSKRLYHSTKPEHLSSIMENGLQPQMHKRLGETNNRLYLAPDSKSAVGGTFNADGVMLRTRAGKSVDNLTADEVPGFEHNYFTDSPILPDALEIKLDGKWLPLDKALLPK
jgi:hypothetical protein